MGPYPLASNRTCSSIRFLLQNHLQQNLLQLSILFHQHIVCTVRSTNSFDVFWLMNYYSAFEFMVYYGYGDDVYSGFKKKELHLNYLGIVWSLSYRNALWKKMKMDGMVIFMLLIMVSMKLENLFNSGLSNLLINLSCFLWNHFRNDSFKFAGVLWIGSFSADYSYQPKCMQW